MRSTFAYLAVALVAGGAGCKTSGTKLGGTVEDEQSFQISDSMDVQVALGGGLQGAGKTQMQVPAGAAPAGTQMKASLMSGVGKAGPQPRSGKVVALRPQGTQFAKPGKLQQALPPPAPGKIYRGIFALEDDSAWLVGGPAVKVAAGGSDTTKMATTDEIWEVEVWGGGVWSIAEGDADGSSGTDAGSSPPDGGSQGDDAGRNEAGSEADGGVSTDTPPFDAAKDMSAAPDGGLSDGGGGGGVDAGWVSVAPIPGPVPTPDYVSIGGTGDPVAYRVLAGARSGGAYVRSIDKGASWSSFTVEATTAGLAGMWGSPGETWFASTTPRVYRSTDSEATWSKLPATGGPPGVPLFAIAAVNSGEVYVCGMSPTIWRTTDGGASFSALPTGAPGDLYALAVRKLGTMPTEIFAVGSGGTVMYSPDAGATFSSPTEPGTLSNLRGIYMDPSGGPGVAVGDAGAALMISADVASGVHQAMRASGVAADLLAVHGMSFAKVFAVGKGGIILKSSDGGMPVRELSPLGNDLAAVWASPDGQVFAAGNGNTILRRPPGP